MALLTMLSSRFRNSSSPSVRLQLRRMASGHCLLFPGQGSQFQGMAKSLIEEAEEGTLPSVAQLFSVAQRVLGYDLRDLFLNGPSSVLDETVHCQPAVVVASLAALESLKHTQPQVGVVRS